MKLAGYEFEPQTREMVTIPSSDGCLKLSKAFLANSPISSRNKTPLWASDILPGRAWWPPPISEFVEALGVGT